MNEPVTSMSFETRRRELLEYITAKTSIGSVKKEVPFLNQDVPNFIKFVNEFVKESDSIDFIVR